MKAIEELVEEMQGQFDKSKMQTVWATVTEVDEDEQTATVKSIVDEVEYFDVNLGMGDKVIIPKVDSNCLIGIIQNKDSDTYLIDCESIEKVQYKMSESLLLVDADGFQIEKGKENLKTVLNDMIDELNKIVVVQGNTINVAAMNAIKERLNSILK